MARPFQCVHSSPSLTESLHQRSCVVAQESSRRRLHVEVVLVDLLTTCDLQTLLLDVSQNGGAYLVPSTLLKSSAARQIVDPWHLCHPCAWVAELREIVIIAWVVARGHAPLPCWRCARGVACNLGVQAGAHLDCVDGLVYCGTRASSTRVRLHAG